MKLLSKSIDKSICESAIHGIMAWAVYGIVESCFSSILPAITQPNFRYTIWHSGFTVLLFCLYSVIGLTIGGLSGWGLCIASRRIRYLEKARVAILIPVVATSSVVLSFVMNLIVRFPYNLTVLALFSISLLLIFCLVISVCSSTWFRRLRFLTNYWITSVVLLGLAWITLDLLENHPRSVKIVVSLSYLVAVFLISFFIQKVVDTRLIENLSAPPLGFPAKSVAFILLVVLFIPMFTSWLNRAPDPAVRNSRVSSFNTDNPNVLLIVMDTVRADYLSLYEYEKETTPNLKKFSNESTIYTHAIAPGDMTLSTHASIFTGLYARQHGAHFDSQGYGQPLHDKFHTLAEILSEKGYLTTGVVANHVFFGNGFGIEQGFDYFDSQEPIQFLLLHRLGHTQKFFLKKGIHDILIRFVPNSEHEIHYKKAEDINSKVFFLLSRMREKSQPLFLFINYMDAHWPYTPPPPFDMLYPGKDEKFTTGHHFDLLREVVSKQKRKITEKEHFHLVSQYSGAIAYLDFQIWKLLERLKDLGLYENCLIIITADHGEAFGERDLIEHGVSVYQDQVHIPLIIKYPNTRQKRVVDEVVNIVDLMPTVLDALGYKIPENIHGQSLLKHDPRESRIVISESYPNIAFLGPRFLRTEYAIFSGSHKFILSTTGKRELYNLSGDPNEKENLYKTGNGTSMDLEMRLNQWLNAVNAESVSPAKLNKETLDRLKALGYLQ